MAVIVVSFNTRELLRQCLASVTDAGEVWVVDNASEDGSAEMVELEFPNVKLVRNDTNRGFGVANNMAIELTQKPLILLLNSDARLAPGQLAAMVQHFRDSGVIALGPQLIFPDGRLQNSCASELTLWRLFCEQFYLEKIFSFSRLFNGYWQNRWLPTDRVSGVDQVMGACLMMRRGLKFDERYFLYCEDTDLCRRLRLQGTILFDPRLHVVHELGASSAESRWKSVVQYNLGKCTYFALHHGPVAHRICWLMQILGAALRMLIPGKTKLFWNVLKNSRPYTAPPK